MFGEYSILDIKFLQVCPRFKWYDRLSDCSRQNQTIQQDKRRNMQRFGKGSESRALHNVPIFVPGIILFVRSSK